MNSSSLPRNIPAHNNHFALSGRGANVPDGPIISPNPGPTLARAVAEPDMAVMKSSPTNDRAMVRREKLRANTKKKLMTDMGTPGGMGRLL